MQIQQGYQPPPLSPIKKRRITARGKRTLLIALAVLVLSGIFIFSIQAAHRIQKARAEQQALVNALSPFSDKFLPNISMDGIQLGGMTAQEGLDAVIGQIHAREKWSLELTYKGHSFFTINCPFLGLQTDLTEVYNELERLYRLGKVGTLEERKQEMDQLAQSPYEGFTTKQEIAEEHLDSILSQIAEQLTVAPVDAYVAYFNADLSDPFIIQPEIYGSALDVASLKEQILEMAASGQGGALEVTPVPVAPQVSQADVRKQITLLCKSTTPVSSTSTTYRTNNIRTAFSRINGQTVGPGKTFSFNATVGKRSEKNGFLPAIEYGEGGLEQVGIGGGVCQASTTLYLAALKSGLQILERYPHSNPVSYTDFGQDATVNDERLDLRFRNTSSGTIYITARVEQSGKNKYQCVVCIYGPSLGDTTYKLRTDTVEIIPAPTEPEYTNDKNHTYVTYKTDPPVLVRAARDGFINETYLQTYVNGRLVSENLVSRDTCKERSALYAVGTLNQ